MGRYSGRKCCWLRTPRKMARRLFICRRWVSDENSQEWAWYLPEELNLEIIRALRPGSRVQYFYTSPAEEEQLRTRLREVGSRPRQSRSRPATKEDIAVAEGLISPFSFRDVRRCDDRKGAGLARVCDATASHTCKRSQRVQLGTVFAHDVLDADSEHSKRIRDEGTVTTPRHRFRAHQCTSFLPDQLDQPL